MPLSPVLHPISVLSHPGPNNPLQWLVLGIFLVVLISVQYFYFPKFSRSQRARDQQPTTTTPNHTNTTRRQAFSQPSPRHNHHTQLPPTNTTHQHPDNSTSGQQATRHTETAKQQDTPRCLNERGPRPKTRERPSKQHSPDPTDLLMTDGGQT